MTDESKSSLGQQYHEKVEALKVAGLNNADAIRQVAAEFGKNENAVRGSLHQYKLKLAGSPGTAVRRARRAAGPTVDDFVASAKKAIEDALSLVDNEVLQAKSTLDAAQAHYDLVAAGVADRRAELQKKLKALA
jgi:hypothetical protein